MKRGQSQKMTSRGLHTDVLISHGDWASAINDVDSLCQQASLAAYRACSEMELEQVEISILLSDDKNLQALNKKYRGVDKPTNVLSFPNHDWKKLSHATVIPQLLGDVVIAFETTMSEAIRDGKKLEDHLSHLVVHGVMHLLGHDHEHSVQAETMETLETTTLAELGISDPYDETEVVDTG